MNDTVDTLKAINETVKGPIVKELSVWEMLFGGGIAGTIIMVILFILFVATVYIFFERYFIIEKASKADALFMNAIRDFVYDGKIESGLDLCKSTNSPEARMIEKGLTRIGRPLEDISQAIENTAKLEVYQLEKRLNTMATIAGAAPMLGFLGTVVGVIIVFFNITHATGGNINPQDLAGGLFTAMGTTAVGLIVGIAAYIGYNYLVSKVDHTVYQLQASAVNFLDVINKPV
ncbi:MAG: MotA/TolQ/ExbB proton channel family protein [Flavobacteriales bacterium]